MSKTKDYKKWFFKLLEPKYFILLHCKDTKKND